MNNFIYVFSDEDKDILLASGYQLLYEINNSHTFVFKNKKDEEFRILDESKYMHTDTLMF